MIIKLTGDFSKLKEDLENGFKKYKKEKESIKLFFEYENGQNIPPFSLELLNSYIKEIEQLYPNQNFDYQFYYTLEEDYIVDSKHCKTLEKVDNHLRENFGKELYITDKLHHFSSFGFRKTLSANRKLDSIANKIKNAKKGNTELSNFEKFMIAYEYVTQFAYNEGGDVFHTETSHWVPVLEGDKIVCVGYASLLKSLCNRIFDPSEVKVLEQSLSVYDKQDNNNLMAGHGNNIIFIKDEKYNIDGLFYVDPCWDSISDNRKDKQQAYCCIPLTDILSNKRYSFKFKEGFTHFYLLQDKRYRELNKELEEKKRKSSSPLVSKTLLESGEKSLEDQVENFFQGFKTNDEPQQYFSRQIAKIDYYNLYENLFEDDKFILAKHKDEIPTLIHNNYKQILEKYKNIKAPVFFHPKLIELYNLDKDFEILENNFEDKEKVEKAIENIARACSDSRTIEYIKGLEENDVHSSTLDSFIVKTISHASFIRERKKLEEKKKTFVEKAKKENTIKLMENINKKANATPIPIEAFINSYRIIGEQNGLKGKELDEYVQNRITKSIERTNMCFDTSECRSCFANIRVEDIERSTAQK